MKLRVVPIFEQSDTQDAICLNGKPFPFSYCILSRSFYKRLASIVDFIATHVMVSSTISYTVEFRPTGITTKTKEVLINY